MRLTVDHSLAAGEVYVPCLSENCKGPHRMLRLAAAQIDIDGPPFAAYYHKECLPAGTAPAAHSLECQARGCAR
jgi:hypothetical protein